MGCLYDNIKSKCMSEKQLINKLIQKRKQMINSKIIEKSKIIRKVKNNENLESSKLFLKQDINEEKNLDKLKLNFEEDINNENNLIAYLEELKKYNREEYELILLLYLNVLSPKNKKKYTGINTKSSLDKYELLLDNLYNMQNIKSSKNNINYEEIVGVADRDFLFKNNIITTICDKNNISLNKLMVQDKEEYLKALDSILSQRLESRVTLDNKEVYFQRLIHYYIDKFAINDKTNFFDFNCMYPILKKYIKDIRIKKTFTTEEKRLYLILFFSLILANNCDILINNYSESNSKIKMKLFDYEEKDGIFYIKRNNKTILQINGGIIINERILESEIGFYQNFDKIPEDKENKIIKSVKPEYFQKYNFYTKNEKIFEFNRNLMKFIFRSETMKSLFLYIFPEVFLDNGNYIFEKNDIFDRIYESIIFVPYNLKDSYAITEKNFLIIFINGLPPDNYEIINLVNGSSSFQILGLHEIGAHWTSAYCSYTFKNKDLFKSVCYENFPIKELENQFKIKKLAKLDGGNIIEKLLFSRVLHETDIREMLFILCKNSYNNSYQTFQKNFKNIAKRELDDVYNEIIEDDDLRYFLEDIHIDLNYLKNISDPIFGIKMKRNGEILRASLCNMRLLNNSK